MNRIVLISVLLFSVISLLSQNKLTIEGMVVDKKLQYPLPGASVVLTLPNDTSFLEGTISGPDGTFSLDVEHQRYYMTISFLGYNDLKDTINMTNKSVQLGVIELSEQKSLLNEVKVMGTMATTLQKGDTTSFNPDAFKVNMDATANDLLLKMPGFYAVDGKLMSMGDTIREVLVDGKDFFEDDLMRALDLIPPKIIRHIEVYPYQSKETKHGGFEESEDGKTINIVTNLDTKAFVKSELSVGMGKEDRYAAKGYYSRFMESNRLNAYANRNNVQVPMRINRGSSQLSVSGNESENSSLGANLGLSGKMILNANYALSDTKTDSYSSSQREYVAGALLGQIFQQQKNAKNKSDGHNIGLKLGSKGDKKNDYDVHLKLAKNSSNNESSADSETKFGEGIVNTSSNYYLSDNDMMSVKGELHYTRKLNEEGRAVSLQFEYSYRDNEGNNKQLSETRNGDGEMSQLIDQFSDKQSSQTDITAGVSFIERLGEYGRLTLGYKYRNFKQQSDKKTMDYDEDSGEYSILDSLTSNTFDNLSDIHFVKLGYRFDKGKFKSYAGIKLKNTLMKSEEVFPDLQKFKESFVAVEPNARLSYTTQSKRNYVFYYGFRQRIPSLGHLQDIVNNSNPLSISTGNPNLKLSSSHKFTLSMSQSDKKNTSFFTLQLKGDITQHMVAQDRVVAQNDTMVLGSYFLPAGGQFMQPINLNGKYYLGINGIYSMPLNKLKSKLNTRSALTYNRTPYILNGVKNKADRIQLSQNFAIASNINEKIDFTFRSQSSYSRVDNHLNTSGQSGTFSQRTSINLYYNFYKKFIFKSNTSQYFNSGYGSLQPTNRWFVNLGISKKLFTDNQGEISFSLYDLAHDQSDLSTKISDLYISESFHPSINKFYMLSFSYSL